MTFQPPFRPSGRSVWLGKDLVQTDDCDDAGVGTARWRVYEGTGAGFAAAATDWPLPDLDLGDIRPGTKLVIPIVEPTATEPVQPAA